jgi:hypothetical protein
MMNTSSLSSSSLLIVTVVEGFLSADRAEAVRWLLQRRPFRSRRAYCPAPPMQERHSIIVLFLQTLETLQPFSIAVAEMISD